MEGDFSSRTPTQLSKNRRGEIEKRAPFLRVEEKHEEGQILIFETKKSEFSSSHFPLFVPLCK
jgi:hypothetical protein